MKIYYYNSETGAYLGEDFADETPFHSGEYRIPEDATTIAPPQVDRGYLAFFNVHNQCWEVRAVQSP